MNDDANEANYGNSRDWAQIIQGLGQGAGGAMQGMAANAGSRKEAKEAKRRTLANLLNNALNRNQNLYRRGQEHSNEMTDLQSQAIQQMARGFIENLKGTTGY